MEEQRTDTPDVIESSERKKAVKLLPNEAGVLVPAMYR